MASRYLNRELSWLEFNHRVLEEAIRSDNPVLERIKFLAIFESNMDEFFMVRVSGLIEQVDAGSLQTTPDGLSAIQQLTQVHNRWRKERIIASKLWEKDLKPALRSSGVSIVQWSQLKQSQKRALADRFVKEYFKLATPIMIYPAQSFPHISNLSLNLALLLKDEESCRVARIKIPSGADRFVQVPGTHNTFILLEDIFRANLHLFFTDVEILGCWAFRVIRDADFDIKELEANDLFSIVEETINKRRFGDPVAIELDAKMPEICREHLLKGLELDPEDVVEVPGQIGFSCLWELAALPLPELKFRPHRGAEPHFSETSARLFDRIRREDVLLHHPFDQFSTLQKFVDSAASDENVIGIKQTLYRVGSESPIVETLLNAAKLGKQVAVVVELKARFDESNNLSWAIALEEAGAHVSYGTLNMKVHSKLCLVIRKEGDDIRSYGHVGTGNYNPKTSSIYTDLGLLTCDEDITQDIAEVFNFLTGFSKQKTFRKLLVAPHTLRERVIEMIRAEAESARAGIASRIVIKLNSLVDPEVIDELYAASEAGVQVDLIVRGICCLIPGKPGLSENIRVVSVIGRFLEHSRVYWFNNRANPMVWIGSADIMRRNLDRRTEVMTPIREPKHIDYILTHVLESALRDTTNAWHLSANGKWIRPTGGERFSSQEYLTKHSAIQVLEQ